jgi:thiol:disulfide interchange protein DsbD
MTASAPTCAAETGINALVSPGSQNQDFLPVDQAFRVSAVVLGADRVQLNWIIAPGYYLYKSRLKFAVDGSNATLGEPDLPKGEDHTDEFFGTQTVYRETLAAALGVARATAQPMSLPVKVTYQGCADAGLCYPPQTATLKVDLPAGNGANVVAGKGAGSYVSEQDQKANIIRSGSWAAMLSLFFLAGLGVAFTGCVLPTIPILSGIIVGAGKNVTTTRAFMLSLTYVLGMAFTYTAAGAITAASGLQVQALFQKTWVVLLFAGLMLLMALSMFGLYTLQMPSSIQSRVTELSNRQKGGNWAGVAVMGALSALIVTACVAPAMIAALAVISQTGDVMRGGLALFAMSIGMGMPLLIVGASAGRLLPRAGAWMDDIKRLAGCMMLAVAAWMLSRLVTDQQALLLFAIPAIAASVILWHFAVRGRAQMIARAFALVAALYAATLIYGWKQGSNDPLHPLAGNAAAIAGVEFTRIHSVGELDARLKQAAAAGQPVMLDFYADWCVSCKEMERYTFPDATVKPLLDRALLLQADVTANNDDDKALMKRFGIIGPPTIAFYDASGTEQPRYRVVGFMKAPAFAELLGHVFVGTAATP